MHSIRIINIKQHNLQRHNERHIKVDRETPVGNPYHMRDESQRDLACDRYQEWFEIQMEQDNEFSRYINNILKIAREHNIALACWCAPKRCHAETIKKYLEQKLQEEV